MSTSSAALWRRLRDGSVWPAGLRWRLRDRCGAPL